MRTDVFGAKGLRKALIEAKVDDVPGERQVRRWISNDTPMPKRIQREILRLLKLPADTKEAPPPQWATELQRGLDALLEQAKISPADERDLAAARAIAADTEKRLSRARGGARRAASR